MNNIFSFVQGMLMIVATTLTTVTAKPSAIIPSTPLNQQVSVNSAAPSAVKPAQDLPPAVTQQKQRPVLAQDTVRAEDSIDYMNQKTTYYIDIPKDGGRISGKMSGLCNGDITGEFNGQTVDFAKTSDRHDITGDIVGTCRLGFLPVSASAKFYGEVSLSTNRVSLTADVEKPFQSRYYPYLRIRSI